MSDPQEDFKESTPYRAPKRSKCRVCVDKKISPRDKARKATKTSHWCPKCEVCLCVGRCFELYTGALNVKSASVLEGALNSVSHKALLLKLLINISLNFHVLIIILITFVIHFFTLRNDDVMGCIIWHH